MGVQPCPAWPFQGDRLPGPREGCNSSFSHQVADDHSQEGSLGGRVPWTWAYWNFLKKVRYLSHSLKSRPNYNSVEEKWLMLVLPLFLSLISRNGALLGVDFPLTIQFQEWCSGRIQRTLNTVAKISSRGIWTCILLGSGEGFGAQRRFLMGFRVPPPAVPDADASSWPRFPRTGVLTLNVLRTPSAAWGHLRAPSYNDVFKCIKYTTLHYKRSL